MINLRRWKIFQKLDPIFVTDIKRAFMLGIDSQQNSLERDDDRDGGGPYNSPTWKGSLMVMRNGDVYSVALDSKHLVLLGQNDFESLLPLVAVKVDGLHGQEIQDVTSGVSHVEVLTTDGRIYEWGKICLDDQWRILQPRFVSGFLEGKIVAQIACGQWHTLALTQQGEVYSWGRNIYGQLGIGDYTDKVDPVKVSGLDGFDRNIIAVACGGRNSYALDVEGKVWSWGSDGNNALGYASAVDQLYPKRIDLLNNIKQIAAGNYHCLALTHDNELYQWGKHTSRSRSLTVPKKVQIPNVVDMAATRGCPVSACKTSTGKVYLWGFVFEKLISTPVPTAFTSFPELFLSLDAPFMLKAMEMDLNSQPCLEKLRKTFDDKATHDISFIVGEETITAHKAVLSLRNDYFKRLFDNFISTNWRFAEFTCPTTRTFLLYLYTDRIEPPPQTAENALELINMAVKFGEEDLKRRCEQQLEVLITEETACKVYSSAVKHNSKVLLDIAYNFIVPNFNTVVSTNGYQNLPEELRNRLILELAEENIFSGLKRKFQD